MMLSKDDLIEQMSREAEAIADLIKATEQLLEEEIKNPQPAGKDNVLHVDFSIVREFKLAQKNEIKLSQMLSVYHDWAFRTYRIAKDNRGNLKNKKILELIHRNLMIVNTITTVLSQNIE